MTKTDGNASAPVEHWIIDTSSVLWIKQSLERTTQRNVYKVLSAWVADGRLLFPKQVHGELNRHEPSNKAPDLPLQWVRDNREKATAISVDLNLVRDVLAAAPQLIDVNSPTANDEADPYVAALGLQLHRQGHVVTIITEDRNDKPRKMSLTTTCGLLRLIALPMEAFLRQQRIYPQ